MWMYNTEYACAYYLSSISLSTLGLTIKEGGEEELTAEPHACKNAEKKSS